MVLMIIGPPQLDVRPTTTLSWPARSRTTDTLIPCGQQRRNGRSLARADLQRDEGSALSLPHQPPDDVEPVGAAEQRLPRLEPDIGREAVAGGDVRRVGDDGVDVRRSPAQQVAVHELDVEPRAAPRSPAPPRAPRLRRRWRRPTGPAAPPSMPMRWRPSPSHVRPPARRAGNDRAASTTNSVSGRGTSTRGSTASMIVRNPFSPRMYATGSRARRRAARSMNARASSGSSSREGG